MNRKKQLKRAYTQKLQNLTKNGFKNKNLGLVILKEQLKYVRDCIILENISDIEREPVNTDIAALATAVAEFEAYDIATDPIQKSFHWHNFCDFIKFNMEEWLLLDDSI